MIVHPGSPLAVGDAYRYPRRVNSSLRRAVAVVATLVMCLGGAALAGAAPVVFSTSPVPGWSTNGPVRAVLIVGDTVYAGGDFTQVRGPGGTPVVNRARLAAWDIRTGALRTGFVADTDGQVSALATDGTRLFVGGNFLTIKGVAKSRLAAVDPASGNVITSWTAPATASVYALRVSGARLYVGGAFRKIGNSTRNRAAAVATATGAVDATFNPNLDNSVRGITSSPDGATVYLAGDFLTVNAVSRPYLAAVSATTGAATPVTFQYPFADVTLHGMIGVDISTSGDQLFGALGGNENRVQAWNTTTGKVQWFYTVMGDTQAVRYYNGNVYFGFHEGAIGDTTVRLLVADALTGTIENSYRPPINSFYGIWAIDASDAGLVLGGEFTTINGVASQGLAIMPPGPTDTVRPSPPGTPAVSGVTGSSVALAWTPGTDDRAVYGYRVLRNGVPVAYVTTTNFTDRGLAGETDYTYSVQTVDTAGNLSDASGTVTARTGLIVVPAGSTWKYLDNGTDQGTAWRVGGFDDSTWRSGAAELGYGDGDEATAIGYGPDPNAKYITSYFRRNFTVADPTQISALTLNLLRDDGAVVYLNGTEVVRSNMPVGTIASATLAPAPVANAEETQFLPYAVSPGLLVAGTNTLAVEIHQNVPTSSDVSFNLSLEGARVQPAPAPTGLSVTGTTDTSVSLAWTAPTGTGTTSGYRVYRDGVQIGTPSVTTFTDSGLVSGRSYSYAVSAITNGTETATTAAVVGTTLDLVAPTAPTGLVASSVSGNSVTLGWVASTDNVGVTAYDVLRDGSIVGTVTTPGYTDATVAPGVTYSYTVRARDAAGNVSASTPALAVTTPATAGTLFADTFDSGSFSTGRWTTAGASLVAGAVSGYFARLTAAAGPAYLTWPSTVIEQGRRSWSLRAYFRVNSRATKQVVSLVELKNAASKSVYVYTNATTGNCTASLGGQTVTTSFRCDDGAWHLLEVKGDMGTTTHTLDWRVDGKAQPSLSVTGQVASTVRNLYLGEPGATPTDVQDWDNVGLTVGDVPQPFLGPLTPFG